MDVKCIANNIDQIDNSDARNRLAESIHLQEGDSSLTIGKTYAVAALVKWNNGGLYVYLHSIEESNHPYPYPIEFFAVTNSIFPANWIVGTDPDQTGDFEIRISFPEWANDEGFFERLLDGDEGAREIYEEQKKNLRRL